MTAMSTEEYPARPDPNRQPTHPGALLREDILPALRLNITEAARALGVSRQTLHNLLAERVAVTPEMALRLGKLCGDGPGIWLRMQVAYDLWKAGREHAAEIERIPTMTAA
jgi:addiction module HigA family antidote